MSKKSKIFEGFRALGLYSAHVPHCTRYHGRVKDHYMFVPVGKVFHTYNCSKFGITNVSDPHPDDIECIAADRFHVFTGCGKTIRAFKHNRQVIYTYEDHADDVHLLLPFSDHLISVDRSSALKIWDIKTQKLYLEIDFENASFEVTALLHPATYVNKVLLGSKQGKMQLWNVRKSQMIYEFTDLKDDSAVLTLVQAPAVDVVAIGRTSGEICIHNLKVDQTIMRFRQDSGPVTGLAFRTDGAATLVSSGPTGNIAVWDLDERRLLGIMERAHSSTIAGLTFLHAQPLLITNSSDNSIKMWAFDQGDGKGRLLRWRSGHAAPPTKIRFYDENGDNIISVGLDSTMQSFSTKHECNNSSFGRASTKRKAAAKKKKHLDTHKLPPIVDFAARSARSGDWDNIIAFHHRHHLATSWNFQKARMGEHKLLHDRFKYSLREGKNIISNCYVTAVTLTECGNFCIVGYNSGYLDVYNIQSGIYRGSFIDVEGTEKDEPREPGTEVKVSDGPAHLRSITGVAVDALNQIAVSGSLDKTLKFWRFKSKKLLKKVDFSSAISILNLHSGSNMLAVALDDFTLKIFDIETRKLVRRFPGHQGAITDVAWSSDSRWLVSCSMDCTIKTWDLPSSSLVDCFLVDSAAVSVTFSPTLELLATCHVDDMGIYLWSNRSIFTPISLHPLPLDYHPVDAVGLPGTMAATGEETGEDVALVEEEELDGEGDEKYQSPDQVDSDLITLSLLPSSRWANLLSLDVIKKRNKPKEPPVVPKSAPFFLPTISGLTPQFDVTGDEEPKSKIIEAKIALPLTVFGKILLEKATNDPTAVTTKMKEFGPSALDVEIKGLSPDNGGSTELMEAFLKFSLEILKTRRDFELIQACLGLFLKTHTTAIASEPTLLSALREIDVEHRKIWGKAQNMLDQSICLVNYIKTATI